jgi:hypothetical protein
LLLSVCPLIHRQCVSPCECLSAGVGVCVGFRFACLVWWARCCSGCREKLRVRVMVWMGLWCVWGHCSHSLLGRLLHPLPRLSCGVCCMSPPPPPVSCLSLVCLFVLLIRWLWQRILPGESRTSKPQKKMSMKGSTARCTHALPGCCTYCTTHTDYEQVRRPPSVQLQCGS